MMGDGTTPVLVEDLFTTDELHAAESAYDRWRAGRGPVLDRRQMEARRAAKRMRSYGVLPPRPRKEAS